MATDENGQGYMPVADVDEELPVGTKNWLPVKILNKASGGGVQSVTGNLVNDDDPINPVVDMPIHMSMLSIATINVSGGLANPSYINGFIPGMKSDPGLVPTLTGPLADQDTGAILNNTGRTITMNGSIAYLTVFTGFSGNMSVWSERSSDGINWTPNANSFRPWDVSFISGGSVTQKSAVLEWADGEYLRFALSNQGGGTLSLQSLSETVNGSQSVESLSVYWTLDENP